MCGIAGIWNRDGGPVDRATLGLMLDSLAHRGPDGTGAYVDREGLALGHRRLAVIDLSQDAAQPAWLPDRSICMVFNGEIHNYPELAAELRFAGAHLRADNDTEVLLWAYRMWGENCFERLNGMWAVAFWEVSRRRLLLSRDRFGIKPLVYSFRGSRVAFASEAKGLLAAFPEERLPDWRRAREFVMRRLPDPDGDERTFFENIRSLRPGEVLSIEKRCESKRQYWSFRPGTEVSRPDAPEAFLALLRDSVKLRLRSEVPLGVTLSGGLDSSTIARIATSEIEGPLHCFSLRYPTDRLDESRYASAVADDPDRYQMHWITPSSEGLLETMAGIVWHHDGPTPMRGRYPQWHVLRAAASHVTVVLGGQGADELLGGYDQFIWPFLLDRLNRRLPRSKSDSSLASELLRLGQVSVGIPRILPPMLLSSALRQVRRAWYRAIHSRSASGSQPAREDSRQDRPYRSRLNNALWRELRHVGLPELLHAEDAISMAFSVESRLPFLDHRLVEFCFSLQYDEKVGDGWTKLLLRRATQELLPQRVRLRRSKLGFPGDHAAWLGTGRGLDTVRDLLLDPASLTRGWLDPKWIRKSFGGSRETAAKWVRGNPSWTWRATTFELWCRQFVDGDVSLRPRGPVRRSRQTFAAGIQVGVSTHG